MMPCIRFVYIIYSVQETAEKSGGEQRQSWWLSDGHVGQGTILVLAVSTKRRILCSSVSFGVSHLKTFVLVFRAGNTLKA